MSLGIPYMGSKRKLAPDILNVIYNRHSDITDLYDLFGGGGAVSFSALNRYKFNVHYNELNSHIYSLVKYLKEKKTLEPKFFDWVTRDMFFEQINRTDADWYSGFVMSCWSFGNKQSSYLYGADIENIKRLAHEFIVNSDIKAMKELGINIPELSEIKDVQKRRVAFCNYIKKNASKLTDCRVQNSELVEHLARMQNLQNLQITNLSYEKVVITGNNPVIYCDIPYKGTGEYKEGNFNHDAFYDWANELDYPVYISEYDAPFKLVDAFNHRSSLSATNNKKKTVESLFFNGKGKFYDYKLF